MIKERVKQLFSYAGIDLTRNMAYDRLTRKIMQQVIGPSSNCIDAGSHQGEMLDLMLRLAPEGKHYAFEPIDLYYSKLCELYGDRASISPYALADKNGCGQFVYVVNDAAYSGLRRRSYAVSKPEIREIEVDIRRLDDIIPDDVNIDFMKIDVEGAEYLVMQGAMKTIRRSKPIIVFEFGMGASDHYETKPHDVFDFLVAACAMKISSLKKFLKYREPITLNEFSNYYYQQTEYYFVAFPEA